MRSGRWLLIRDSITVAMILHRASNEAMRPTKPPNDRKSWSVRVPLDAAERSRIEALAAAKGLSMSSMIRFLVREAATSAGLP